MTETEKTTLGALARSFNQAVDNLFLMNFAAKNTFYYGLTAQEEAALAQAAPALFDGRAPATTAPEAHLARAEIYAAVLSRKGYEDTARELVPANAQNDEVRAALSPNYPAFARLCR